MRALETTRVFDAMNRRQGARRADRPVREGLEARSLYMSRYRPPIRCESEEIGQYHSPSSGRRH